MAPGNVFAVTRWASGLPAASNGAAGVAAPAGPGLGGDGEQADRLSNRKDTMDTRGRMDTERCESMRETMRGALGFGL